MLEINAVPMEFPADANIIVGQAPYQDSRRPLETCIEGGPYERCCRYYSRPGIQ